MYITGNIPQTGADMEYNIRTGFSTYVLSRESTSDNFNVEEYCINRANGMRALVNLSRNTQSLNLLPVTAQSILRSISSPMLVMAVPFFAGALFVNFASNTGVGTVSLRDFLLSFLSNMSTIPLDDQVVTTMLFGSLTTMYCSAIALFGNFTSEALMSTAGDILINTMRTRYFLNGRHPNLMVGEIFSNIVRPIIEPSTRAMMTMAVAIEMDSEYFSPHEQE